MTGDNGTIHAARWVIENAFHSHSEYALFVHNGDISDIGRLADLTVRHPLAEVKTYGNALIMSGFVNAHHHCFGVNLINQAISDDVLEPWMLAASGAASITSKLNTEFAALRLLKNGVTAVVDSCSAGPTAASAESKIYSKIEVYRDLGMSCAIAPGERWQSQVVHPVGQDRSFLANLPSSLRDNIQSLHVARERLVPQEYVNLVEQLHNRCARAPTADVWFGPTAPHWVGTDVLSEISKAAQRSGVRFQTHLEESRLQHLSARMPNNRSGVAELERLGLLNDHVSLAHMVWADDADIGRVAETGAHIVCNPSSNLRLRSGIARAPLMKQLGVSMALGTDGTSLAGDGDMFAEMRVARNLYWSDDPEQPDLTAQDVFEMATSGGARVMGIADRIGELSAGKRADFLVVDLDRITTPWVSPCVNPVELLVAAAKSDDIRSVYVNGTLTVQDGDILGRNEQAILAMLKEEMQAAVDPRLSREDYATLRVALQNWYADWLSKNLGTT